MKVYIAGRITGDPRYRKKKIQALWENYPDLFQRAIDIEHGAVATLKTIKGLGRNWLWERYYNEFMANKEFEEAQLTFDRLFPDAPLGALSGPGCLCYVQGRRMDRPCRVGRKKPKLERPQAALSQEARWESMRAMHRQGGNDVQIAGEMGCSVSAVRRWRVRQGLPPNGRDGWNKRRGG